MKTGLAIMVAALAWVGAAAVSEAGHRPCGSAGGWYGRPVQACRPAAWSRAPVCPPRGHYEYRSRQVWVPSRWVTEHHGYGGFVRQFYPAHHEWVTVLVWING